MAKTFTFQALDDADDTDETVVIGFEAGSLPAGVTLGTHPTKTVTITDDDVTYPDLIPA